MSTLAKGSVCQGVGVHASESLPHLVASHGQASPDRPFLREVTGSEQTYGETDARGREYARHLSAVGVGAGDCVLVMLPTSIDAINTWLGLSWLGAVDVPINTAFQGRMLAYVINSSEAEVIVCAERWLDRISEISDSLDKLRTIVVLDADEHGPVGAFDIVPRREFLALEPQAEPDMSGPSISSIAMMMFTSGTTGASKGVRLPWGAFVRAGHNILPPSSDIGPDDVLYLPYPLFHTSGTQWTCMMARLGGTIILRESFSTNAFWSDVRIHGCTVMMMLGAIAGFISRSPERPDDADNPLRYVAVVPTIPGIDEFERRFDLRTWTLYGSTELGLVLGSDLQRVREGSCGWPREGYELRLVDDLDLEVALGSPGELVVRPVQPWSTFTEYFNMPEATIEAFRNLWFHTGDTFAEQPDGQLVFVDRKKDAIRRRGENISSAEVERLVLDHTDIMECAAIAVPAEFSEDEVKIDIVLKPGRTLDPADLIQFLVQQKVPAFMIPRYVEIHDDLPKTLTGKVRKDQLRVRPLGSTVWERPDRRKTSMQLSTDPPTGHVPEMIGHVRRNTQKDKA